MQFAEKFESQLKNEKMNSAIIEAPPIDGAIQTEALQIVEGQ